MPVPARQFSYLSAIGIDLWQTKHNHPLHQQSEHQQTGPTAASVQDIENTVAIGSLALENNQFYQDVLRCLGLSAAEVKTNEHILDLGLFNWRFHHQDNISFEQHTLVTPPPANFSKQPALKASLWQTLQQQRLL